MSEQFERSAKRTEEFKLRIEKTEKEAETAEQNYREASDRLTQLETELAQLDEQILELRSGSETRRSKYNEIMALIAQIGRVVLGLLEEIGRLSLFTRNAMFAGLLPPFYLRQIFDQFVRIGYNSLPVVGLTAFFTGGVLALQIYIGGSRFNAESVVPSIVSLAITRELGPVLAGLMVVDM